MDDPNLVERAGQLGASLGTMEKRVKEIKKQISHLAKQATTEAKRQIEEKKVELKMAEDALAREREKAKAA